MAIIGVKCLNHILNEIKEDYVDFDLLSSEEAGRIFASYLTVNGSHNYRVQDGQNKEKRKILPLP